MTVLEVVSQHILSELSKSTRPLFVALQGPQGSGKSCLSAHLQAQLSSPPYLLRVAVLSIDDIYLTHEGLVSLATSYPENPLWQGRGQPGTHDVDLGVRLLDALKGGNSDVEIPRFDKSLFHGEGDRLPMDGTGTVISQPPAVDVVILEGWCVGFCSISEELLNHRWDNEWKAERQKLGLAETQVARKVDLQTVNKKLQEYDRMWNFFNTFIQITPAPPTDESTSQYSIIYKWRLEQEHNMKAKNGGRGMSDEAVKTFVDRYIPGYVFFGGVMSGPQNTAYVPRRENRGLTVLIDENRTLVGTSIS